MMSILLFIKTLLMSDSCLQPNHGEKSEEHLESEDDTSIKKDISMPPIIEDLLLKYDEYPDNGQPVILNGVTLDDSVLSKIHMVIFDEYKSRIFTDNFIDHTKHPYLETFIDNSLSILIFLLKNDYFSEDYVLKELSHYNDFFVKKMKQIFDFFEKNCEVFEKNGFYNKKKEKYDWFHDLNWKSATIYAIISVELEYQNDACLDEKLHSNPANNVLINKNIK